MRRAVPTAAVVVALLPFLARAAAPTAGDAVVKLIQIATGGGTLQDLENARASLGCAIGVGECPGGVGKIEGVVYAPNGLDPVPGAVVYAPAAQLAPGKALGAKASSTCADPGEPVLAQTCTGADGAFSLDGVPTGQTTVVLAKGLFRRALSVSVGAGTTALAKAQTTLPKESGPGAQTPKIAVVTGLFDRIQDVLAKLGLGSVGLFGDLTLGTEKFTLVDGANGMLLNALPDGTYMNFDEFMDAPNLLETYDLLVLNCGVEGLVDPAMQEDPAYEDLFVASAAWRQRIADYVSGGGRVYATDYAYDFLEQTFPAYLEFLGDDPAQPDAPGAQSAAQEGFGSADTAAEVLDAGLRAWLDGSVLCGDGAFSPNDLPCLDADDKLSVKDLLGTWAVFRGPHAARAADVKIWVQGPAEYGEGVKTTPFTATFAAGAGRAFFSSYHTSAVPHPNLLPQERVLQYLVFETLQ